MNTVWKTALRVVLAGLWVLPAGSALATGRRVDADTFISISDSGWEVVARGSSRASIFWCGAGDYAIARLGAPVAQRIYLWRAIGPSTSRPGLKSVQFSLSAPKGISTTPGLSLSVKHVGDNMTVAVARQYCYEDQGFDR